jgi:uncharacterized membrane protein
MMLHKIFHMNQSVDETKRRLGNVSSYRHHLDGVESADEISDGVSQWRLQLPLGFRAEFTLQQAANEDGDTLAFKSVGGDLEIAGMVSFHEILPNLTEVDITLNYESGSALFNMLDRMLNVGDQFLVNQLRRVRAHFEGIATPAPRRAEVYGQHLKPVAA